MNHRKLLQDLLNNQKVKPLDWYVGNYVQLVGDELLDSKGRELKPDDLYDLFNQKTTAPIAIKG